MSSSRRGRLWLIWATRDARRRWLQIASIGLLLALGVGMYSAMSSMSRWRTASADASFAALRMHDLRVSLTAGSYAQEGRLRSALASIAAHGSVVASEERLVVPTQVDASRGAMSIIVPGRIVGEQIDPPVDAVATVRGRELTLARSKVPVVELERNFAKHYGLPSAGTLRLSGDRTVRYIGQALAPEYFIVTAPGADFGAQASFAVLFSSLRDAQLLSGNPGKVNELVLRLAAGARLGTIEAQLGPALRRALPGTGFTFTAGAQEAARRLLYKDAEGDQQMMDIFAALLLGAAAFAAFNLISRTIEAQRREIGIGMALGVRPRALAIRPLLLGAQVAVLGVAVGIPAGLAANAWLRSVMQSFFPLPVMKTSMQTGVFVQGAALGLSVSLLATVIPLRRALAVAPVDAIRIGARSGKRNGLAWITRRMRLPGGSLASMPVRNVLRAPRRTLMTVLGIAAVVAITLALAGVVDSFNATLRATRSEALASSPQRLTVDLATPQPADGPVVRAVTGSPLVGRSQASLRMPVTLVHGERQIEAFLEFVSPSAPLWRPAASSGTFPSKGDGLLIARRAADDLRVRAGDSISVRLPSPSGHERYSWASTRLLVTGTHTSPLRFVAYANGAAARSNHLWGLVNRLSVTPAPGHTAAQLKRALIAMPAVSAVQGAAAMTDAVNQTMSQFTEVLVITVVIAVTMALLIAYNSAAIGAEERTREHATMFAYGVTPLGVLRGNVIEALLVGALATLIGLLGGYGILRWIVNVSMAETMPDLGMVIAISAGTYGLAALAGIVSVALAPMLTLKRLRHTDIPSALRVAE